MNNKEAEEILACAMDIGELLLSGGAEVERVEDTVRRICLAYGAQRADVFSITSSILTTISGDDFGSCTLSRRIKSTRTDMHRIELLNQLSRDICREKPSPTVIRERLKRIAAEKTYSMPMQLLIYALIAGSFAVFFGGSLGDMIAAAITGMVTKLAETRIRRSETNVLFSALLCSLLGGFLAKLLVAVGIGSHIDLICIGDIMLLIPGVAFTNSLRDMFSGDTVTGLIRFCESVIISCVIAFGFISANLFF